jgi:hypothetical protein
MQGSTAPLPNLSALVATSVTPSMHAVEEPGLPLENFRADAPGSAELECALKGGRPLVWWVGRMVLGGIRVCVLNPIFVPWL